MDAAHEEVLRVKDEELEQALQERDDLKDRLKLAESKLSDVQGKNNVSPCVNTTPETHYCARVIRRS